MEKQDKQSRKWISFRVKPGEYRIIHDLFQESTCNKFSEYARLTLMQKPVVIRYRNQSADEILSSLLKIKNELSAIGNNLNQSVRKLHGINTPPEIMSWLMLQEATRHHFLRQVEEIKHALIKISEQWLPGSPAPKP
ncbi:plasmid mobilization protein [Foetidibacter luteolus]|uniref:plasmid mobilization protein n=1 Tax=Foetidibacter luteolus TaxID=2608880 RepID=UPI00129A49DB|nr:plasmid mobilization relaxosome protein MobC [Foetidibacter luteolus]